MELETENYLRRFIEETAANNCIVLGSLLPESLWKPLPHILQSWLRIYIAGVLLYLIFGSLCYFYTYHWKRNAHRTKDLIPSSVVIKEHIVESMKSFPWYSALAMVSEYMIERGWTQCFSSISEVGWPAYVLSTLAYLTVIEIGIYWAHRELHDIKPLYRLLHAKHHLFNKQNMISPFAGFALNPLDGIIQAMPHVLTLFVVPTHFRTHLLLLFVDGLWTINIHDNVHGQIWPIMGAGYHTVHHTTNRHNYGHYTVWMDWMFGTLREPAKEGKGTNPHKVD